MAELFDATKQNISLHLKNIFEDGELDVDSVVKDSLTVQVEGRREVQRPVKLYSLDAILAVGYHVRSPCGVLTYLNIFGPAKTRETELAQPKMAREERISRVSKEHIAATLAAR